MDGAQKLIQAIASLLWPLIVVALIVIFRPAVAAIVDSAKSRRFTLKIGGQELTMEEANKVQQTLIADLQSQVAEMLKALDGPSEFTVPSDPDARTSIVGNLQRVLWIDDNPKNNSYFIQQLIKSAINVDIAESTAEGMVLFGTHDYSCVLTDMGRKEGDSYIATAGLELVRSIRRLNAKVPIIVFCSNHAMRHFGQQALESGATAITSSPTELVKILGLSVPN